MKEFLNLQLHEDEHQIGKTDSSENKIYIYGVIESESFIYTYTVVLAIYLG